jgi:hypothetical protein
MKRFLIALFLCIFYQAFGSEFVSAEIANDFELKTQKNERSQHQNTILLELADELVLPYINKLSFNSIIKNIRVEEQIKFFTRIDAELPDGFSHFIFKEILFVLLFPKHFFF